MRIGLKLWSKNTDYYYAEARRLYKDGWFDYIELFVVPGTTDTINKWKILRSDFDIPFALHAPHSMVGVNLADKSLETSNAKAYEEVAMFADALSPKFTVVHAGINGTIEETIRQLNVIRPKNILIENKPYKTIYGEPICRGSSIEEIKKVLEGYNCGFCLDIGHAICTANANSIEPYGFVEEFQQFLPSCYHISDNDIHGDIDKHLHIGQGNYDVKRIFCIIDTANDIAIETIKDSGNNLNDFTNDVQNIRKCL